MVSVLEFVEMCYVLNFCKCIGAVNESVVLSFLFFFFRMLGVFLFCFVLFLFIYLFIFGCVGSSFLCEGFLQLRQAGATLHRGARASHCRGLSHCGA